MELLIVNEETLEVSVAPELLELKAFRTLVSKNPKQAKKMLAFIRLVEHPLSPFVEYPLKEREERVKKMLGLTIPPLDTDFIEARAYFRDTVKSSNSETIKAIREGLFSAVELIDRSSSLINVLLDEVDVSKMKNPKSRIEAIKSLKDANELLDSMLDKASKVPKTMETLDDLSEKLRKRMAQSRRVRGKGDINPFEE